MLEKESALRLAATNQQGGNGDNLNLSQRIRNVKSKSESDQEYLQNTFTRFKLLRFAQSLLVDRMIIPQNSGFSKCHRTALGSLISLMRNPKSNRGYYNGVCTCGNSKLCPVCAARIMGKRSVEIRQAVDGWLAESPENTCYMITLTLSHCASDDLCFLLDVLKKALVCFWAGWGVKNMLSLSGRVGRITSVEIQYSQKNGFHPHQHILIFGKKFNMDVDLLRRFWLAALESASGSANWENGLTCIEACSASDYLCKSKISSEMTMGNLKQGRAVGHYSPMQILFEAANGSHWAADVFCELFQGLRGLHSLFWSRGLKARFGIGEVSDEQITQGAAQPELVKFLDLFSDGFRRLSTAEKAMLRNYCAVNDWEHASNLLNRLGVEYFKDYQGREVL